MRENKQHNLNTRPKRRLFGANLIGIFIIVLFGASLFSLGWATGSGQLTLPGDQLSSQNRDLPEDLNYSDVEEVYDALRKSYDGKLTVEQLLDGIKEGLAKASGDPYTEFMNAKDAKAFTEDLQGSFTGIGAQLGKNERGNVIVVSPIDGFPAKQAGLRPSDVIAEVNGEDASEWSIEKVVDNIRGPAGTVVKLRIIRGDKEDLTIEIKRAEITIPSVEYEMKENQIGYIQISQFGDDTVALATVAATNLKNQGAKSIILDLRGNPGGYLQGAVDIASIWLEPGKTVLEEKRGGVTIDKYESSGTAILAGLKTVVLIDEGSASASEIVAGALKDNNVATLIGATSFGKGSVQQPQKLISGGLLKVTIARWYTPSGHNIDKEGIKPDKSVEITDEDISSDKDPQLEAALKYLQNR